jgi:DNA-binding IclR family transcriptional regulator
MSEKKTNRSHESSGVAAVNRALAILTAFEQDDEGLSLAELSKCTGLYKSTVLRLIQSLIQYDFLRKAGDGRYHIGLAPLVLGSFYLRSLKLADTLLPVMRDLVSLSGEGMSFYVRSGDMRLCLYRVDSEHEVRDHVRVGDILPLEKGSGGRVLCAFSNMQGDLYKGIRRDCCYASYGERESEIAGISVPVFGPGGTLLGALTLAGPRSRVNASFIENMRIPLLTAAALATASSGGNAQLLQTAINAQDANQYLKDKAARQKPSRPSATQMQHGNAG